MYLQNLASNKFSQTPRPDQNVKRICLYKLTGGYRKRYSGSRAMKQHVIFLPEISVNIFSASRPRRRRVLLGRKGRTVSTSHIPTTRGRSRAASGPRQGAENIRKSSETASPTQKIRISSFLSHAILRSRTDLEWKKSRV